MSQNTRPILSMSWKMARNRQTVTEQLVDGLVMGAMLGPGLIIVGREAKRIDFKKAGGFFHSAPDRGEILLSDDETGETKIVCQIWCSDWRRLVLISVLSLLIGVGFARFSSLESLYIGATAVVLSVVISTGGLLRDRARLRRQLGAYMHNLIYLKAL